MTEFSLTRPNPLVRNKVTIFYVPENITISELAKKLKELNSKAILIVGKTDDNHLQLYKEAIKEAEIDPLLVRIVDISSEKEVIDQNKVILENAWTAELAFTEEKAEPLSRRDLIRGNLRKVKIKIDKPVYINNYCNWLYRACNICEESCPYNAIIVDKKSGVIINYEKCVNCGLCVASCPTSAIQYPSVSQQSIFELAKLEGEKKITCYKNEKNDGIKVPCLAMLSDVDIALLRSNGKLRFECVGCELKDNLKKFLEIIKEFNNLYGGISFVSPFLKIEEPKEEKNINKINYQSIFNRAEARKELMRHEVPVQYEVHIDNTACTICESCIKWCPTSALKLVREDEKEKIVFNPLACIGCNICENVCPESCGAGKKKVINVSRSNAVSKEEKEIFADELVRCKVCKEPIGSRKSINHIKKIMEERGLCVDDEWLERCPKHRAEYSFQKRFGFQAKFKPRKEVI